MGRVKTKYKVLISISMGVGRFFYVELNSTFSFEPKKRTNIPFLLITKMLYVWPNCRYDITELQANH